MLTNSLKLFDITKGDFFQPNFFTVINECAESAVVDVETVFHPVYYVVYLGVF